MTKVVNVCVGVWFAIICFFTHSAHAITFIAEDLPPYHYKNEDGEIVGALVDIAKAVLEDAKLAGKFEIMPMARAYHQLETDRNTIMMSLLKNPQREDLFHWLGDVYFADAYLVSLQTFKGQVTTLEDAKNYRVGTINGYSSAQYLKDKGFTDDENLVLVSHYTQLWQMLFKRRLDFVLTNTLTLENELKSVGFKVSDINKRLHLTEYPSILYFAANQQLDQKISELLMQSLINIKTTGQHRTILQKWQLSPPDTVL